MYPVGSIYISATLTTVEQVKALFGGEWELFGSGRCLVGKDSSSEFGTMLKTGGEKVHTLTTSEMPTHSHRLYSNNTWGDATVGMGLSGSNTSGVSSVKNGNSAGYKGYYNSAYNDSTQLVQNTGGGSSHNNLQPYIVVSMFKRTALATIST